MTETEEKEGTEIERKDQTPLKPRVIPIMYTFTDDEDTGYDIEVHLPGVDKDKIDVKLSEEYIYVAGESERVKYEGTFALCCPVEPGKSTSRYHEGLLTVHVPYKEVEIHTVDVKVE